MEKFTRLITEKINYKANNKEEVIEMISDIIRKIEGLQSITVESDFVVFSYYHTVK